MDTRHNILIVDDDSGFRKTLSDILSFRGYTTSLAERGETALTQLKINQPVVALIDLKLEDISGLDLMREIKTHAPGTECIVLTGYASQTSAIEAVNLGAYGYMQKPYNVDQLLLLIQRAIEKHKTELALQQVAELRQRLLQVAQSMLATLAFDEVVQQIHQSLQKLLTYDSFELYELDEHDDILRPLLLTGAPWMPENMQEQVLPLGQGLLGTIAQSGQPRNIANARLHSDAIYPISMPIAPEHILCLPVQNRGKMTGLFVIGRKADPPFTSEEFELAQLFTSYASLALENAKLFEQTRLSEKRYRTLFEESKDTIVILSPTGQLIDANPAAVELLGLHHHEELWQVNLSDYIHVGLEDELKFRRLLAEQGFVKDFEAVITRKDRQALAVLGTITAVHDKNGEIAAYQAIVRDVTERQRLESQLRQSQKMEAIGRLAGGVAHDFNNLLTVILGQSELLLQQYPHIEPDQRSALEGISQAAHRAASLTRQLLAFSRQQVLQPRVLNLNQVVTNIEKMLRRLIGEDIDLTTILGREVGQIKADPGQIEQVIFNLAINARDAMPYGGKLTIETSNVELDASYARRYVGVTPGQYVMLAIGDTGQGMDEETQSHIFEPFFTTKEQGQGTGLGLATVHGIVSQSEGHIWLYSEPGHGTIFKVYLPRINEQIESFWPAKTLNKPARPKETILLVEDEITVRELAHRVLVTRGYQVLIAQNGVEALEISKQQSGSIHLLLTDVVMPGGISGRQLAEFLVPLRPAIKVLYMSGYTNNAIVHHGVLDWGIAFLQKPFTPNELLQKVQLVLDTEPAT